MAQHYQGFVVHAIAVRWTRRERQAIRPVDALDIRQPTCCIWLRVKHPRFANDASTETDPMHHNHADKNLAIQWQDVLSPLDRCQLNFILAIYFSTILIKYQLIALWFVTNMKIAFDWYQIIDLGWTKDLTSKTLERQRVARIRKLSEIESEFLCLGTALKLFLRFAKLQKLIKILPQALLSRLLGKYEDARKLHHGRL